MKQEPTLAQLREKLEKINPRVHPLEWYEIRCHIDYLENK